MQIYVENNGQSEGPFTELQIRAGVDSGQYKPDVLAWTIGMKSWQPLATVILLDTRKLPNPSWTTAARDAAFIFIFSALGGAVAALLPENFRTEAILISSLLTTVGGFTVAGCYSTQRRFCHLLRVALLVWMGSLLNVVLFGVSFSDWLTAVSVFLFLAMLAGWVLSVPLRKWRAWHSDISPLKGAIPVSIHNTSGDTPPDSTVSEARRKSFVRMINISAALMLVSALFELCMLFIPWLVDYRLGMADSFPRVVLLWFLFRVGFIMLFQIFQQPWLSLWVAVLVFCNAIVAAGVAIKVGWPNLLFGSMGLIASIFACGVSVLAVDSAFTLSRFRGTSRGVVA